MTAKGQISKRRINMTGYIVGKLTVISPSSKRGNRGELFWDCECECGNKTTVVSSCLRGKVKTESCGCLSKKHFVDYTGQTFHNIKVIRHLGKDKTNNNIYHFECFCGNIFTSQISDIKNNKIASCGCKKNSKQILDFLKDEDKGAVNSIYAQYRLSAKKADREFTLTTEEFRELLESPCHYCTVASSNIHHKGKPRINGTKENYKYNGVDRRNNDEGYTIENAVTACRHCNISKHTLNEDYFIERAYKISTVDMKRNKTIRNPVELLDSLAEVITEEQLSYLIEKMKEKNET